MTAYCNTCEPVCPGHPDGPDARVREALFVAELLHTVSFRLGQYRDVAATQRLGDRPALSDLATMEDLIGRFADFEHGDRLAIRAMARMLVAGETPMLGGDGGHFTEAVHGGHSDDVSDALDRLGIDPWPEPEGRGIEDVYLPGDGPSPRCRCDELPADFAALQADPLAHHPACPRNETGGRP